MAPDYTTLPLPERLILLVQGGSEAYGTQLPGASDHDEIGVVIERLDSVMGIAKPQDTAFARTQPPGVPSKPGDVDRQVYSLRKLARLAADGNPSILAVFWSPTIATTGLGDRLQRMGSYFVGRHVIPKFRGYMRSQTLRLLGLRGNAGHGPLRDDLTKEHGYDTKYAAHVTRLGLQGLELVMSGRLHLPMYDYDRRHVIDVRMGRLTFEEWWDDALALDAALEALESDSHIPERANLDYISSELVAMHLEFWRF